MDRREFYNTPISELIEMSYAKAEMNVTSRIQQAQSVAAAIATALGDEKAISNLSEMIIPVSQRKKELTPDDIAEHNQSALKELLT